MTGTLRHRVSEWLQDDDAQQRIGESLGGTMSGATFAEHCIVASRDPKLAQCDPGSLLTAFLECAKMALPPGKKLGLVALIVDRKGAVTVRIQWQGHKVLMERIAGVKRVVPVLIHMRDEVTVEATGSITHSHDYYDPDREFNSTADLRGGYLRIEWESGDPSFHMVSRSKIERNRRCALDVDNRTGKARPGSPWDAWFPEMCAKTIIRDAWARRAVPFDPAAAPHLAAAEAHERALYGEDPTRTVVVSDPSERALTWSAADAETKGAED